MENKTAVPAMRGDNTARIKAVAFLAGEAQFLAESRCVHTEEYKEARRELREALRDIGVTDAEIEAAGYDYILTGL